MRAALGVALALSLALLGCLGSLKAPAPEIRDFRLDYSPPTVGGTGLPVILQVAHFRAAAVYARPAIVYRESDYETGTYLYDRWIASPASMLADLLARDLAASGLYRAVQQGMSILTADYELSADVDEVEERLTKDGCRAHLRLRVLLIRTRATEQPVLLQQGYQTDEPCASDTVEGFVAALSHAAQRTSARVQEDIYAAIANDPQRRSQGQRRVDP